MSIKKGARRLAREYALQALYSWLVAKKDAEIGVIEANIRSLEGFEQADAAWFNKLFHEIIANYDELAALFEPFLDRSATELSYVEHAVLLIATYEFKEAPDIPYRVILNEAVELAKDYGATDGFKFVNGVLDKLALELRPYEIKRK